MLKDTRNLLFNTTQAIRRLLEEEFSLQLEGTFDVHAEGRVAEQPGSQLSASERLVRCRIVEAIQHRSAVGESAAEAVRGFQSEAVFTFLNRLAALKMMEARALVLPCVSQGDQSQGFKEFSGLAPGLIELPDKGYRLYLECLFDEIGREVGVLFDRTDAASQLWPRRKALEAALAQLNTPELAGVWAEDETIGWIYQYYNDPQERKKMREESSAPRNSRELAVRNQFFTPRYVVEFLTDNTLGRIWYEMTKGQTRLKDQCRYLVRRPTEIFLGPASEVSAQHQGAASAKDSASTLNPDAEPCTLSQEDLLRQPVHIPHRPFKDPREIRMIDPACGSMHFGLYAFDLFTVIYDEAWEMARGIDAATKSAKPFGPFVTFTASFSDKASFLREVPRLIVEHNIHGIDIDPRAAQIAGLALWLRAQRAWQALGLKSSDRPPIRRSNIVCAEPMPGEKELLREFVDRQFPPAERPLFQSFLEHVWDKMRLAGDAGSLLKIEEEVRSAIEEAREAWRKLSARPMELFSTTELKRISSAPELTGMDQAVSSLTTGRTSMGADFWKELEERIYNALRDYAEQAQSGGGFQRRLFAEDAARGFAFIDVCRKRYDVALMNPPFGEASDLIRPLLQQFVSFTDNIAAPFGERFLLRSDFVAMVLDRALLIRKTHEAFRRLFLAKGANRLRGFANYGWGVLDANVEVAGVVASDCTVDATYLLAKEADAKNVKWIPSNGFSALPNLVISDDVPEFVLSAFAAFPALGDFPCCARVGHQWKSERFLRLWWEGNVQGGPFVYNGAPFSPYVYITRNRMTCDPNAAEVAPETSTVLRNQSFHYLPGVAYGKRGIHLDAHFLPAAHTFTVEGLACFPDSISERLVLLAYLNSLPVSGLLQFFCGQHKHVGYLNCLPFSQKWKLSQRTEGNLLRFLNLKRSLLLFDETSPIFGSPFADGKQRTAIAADWNSLAQSLESLSVDFTKVHSEVGAEVAGWLGFPSGWENNPAFKETMTSIPAPDATDIFDEADFQNEAAHCARIMGILVGQVFGRWDIQYATGEQATPELPDPFAPLPVCPPGQLQNAQGLPARPEDVPAAYPVRIPWDGILVDDPNHPLDIERRVREVIEIIWSGQAGSPTAEAIEHEACEILGVKSLRDYFRKPAGFFADHLKRYSKSRRQAPIYWPLSSPNGLYTVWLYYHRLTADTLFTVLRDHVKPKLEYEERQAFQLRQEAGATPSTSQRRDIAEAEELVEDLRAFKAELDRVAPLFRPDLNDGVIINHAPLWRMIGLPKWRKDCQATWNELVKGDYDWAHLALHLWPERVIPKCATDRSLAIAHGLDAIFWREDPEKPGKWITRKVTDLELRGLIAERTSAAVKAAVDSLVEQQSTPSRAVRRKNA